MLPIQKIYIDTRHSTADSKSTSDFKISLPNNITLPSNTAFYITDIAVPVSWYTVAAGNMLASTSESIAPTTLRLNALSPKGTIAQLHLGLLCVKR